MLFAMPPSRLLVVAGLLCACAGAAVGRRSPHADFVDSYYRSGPEAGRFSDNLLEDATLDAPDLVRKYGYPLEVHQVTTEDGYILEMHRIPHGRNNPAPDPNRPVVFVMHGLLCSSAAWVVMGPEPGLGYILADAGYDVWLGNARGTYYSRNHTTMDPDNSRHSFWEFSWNEIGQYDLPAMIDYTLLATGKSRLHYIGHSQGTTSFFVMASLRPEYNAKIIAMQAYAPVAFMEHNDTPLFRLLAPYADNIETVTSLIGVNELLPNSPLFTWAGQEFCADGKITQPVCTNILFLAIGGEEDMFNSTMLPVKLGHFPAGAAVRQIVHYGQHIRKTFFRRYDHGRLANWRVYRSFTPPSYDLRLVTAPVFLHYVDHDVFAHVDDVDTLWRRLGTPIAKMRVPHATFSHMDFMWGVDAKSLLFDRTINLMRSLGSD